MSRFAPSALLYVSGFPRVSGDEPVSANLFVASDAFSPRERG